ncbi:putative cell division protein [Halarchaeum acidiphilum MH1-52-1]|uniref:Protein pelota homolog n=1 Tax=Halarchaeum acidiphilum MH1-52-1 TaxID=1261545 RepID=U3A1B1_9EURY|nr:mRNA surveillance protein pelota [Halarchaeum acidiphilum]GAD51419.1 putative cell division protein [Halarchaeum acidiphilum MH1-52-1]
MQIKERAAREGGREELTLVPESLDDLWHLAYVLEPGDRVSGDTTRRIQRADDQMRDTGGQREPMWIALDIEDVEFHKFANRLRVSGVIDDCSREDQLGLHHTLNVEEFDEIAVTKRWKPDQIERVEEAVETADQPEVAIATIEEGEAYIHTVQQYGVEESGTFTGTTGKGEYARGREELFAELGQAVERMDPDAVILAGPGFTKQDALDYFDERNMDFVDRVTTVDTSAAGGRGVHEVLKRGAVEEVQAETRIAEESELIDELMERLGTDEPVAYGIEEVAKAADFGAVETLLVLDERLRKERADEGDWDVDVNDVITSVEQQGGDVTVFSHEFAPGERLRNLGGIAALLRYRLN